MWVVCCVPVVLLSAHWGWNKHSGTVASKHQAGGRRNTYIREDLKLCTHGSPQDRPAYSSMSMASSLCALCRMHLCDGTADSVLVARCRLSYRIQYHSSNSCFKIQRSRSNTEAQWRESYFHMLPIPSDLWNYVGSFIIHIGCGVITIFPSGLPLTP